MRFPKDRIEIRLRRNRLQLVLKAVIGIKYVVCHRTVDTGFAFLLSFALDRKNQVGKLCSCVIRSLSGTVLFALPIAVMIFEMSKTASEPFLLMIFIAYPLPL